MRRVMEEVFCCEWIWGDGMEYWAGQRAGKYRHAYIYAFLI